MLSKIEMNYLTIKYGCWIDSMNRIFFIKDETPILLGRIYWKSSTEYYHAINVKDKRYEGQKDFEILLINFLKGEGIIK